MIDTEVLKNASLHSLVGLAMLQECLMTDYQRKYSIEDFMRESVTKVAERSATLKDLL